MSEQKQTPAPFMPFNPAEAVPATGTTGDETTIASATSRKRNKRKPAKSAAATAAPKYDLQTVMRATLHLKEGDQDAFAKIVGEIGALTETARERIMKALKEIFG